MSCPIDISTHAPHTGCNVMYTTHTATYDAFQLMHPIRDATMYNSALDTLFDISTHALHTGCNRKT